MCSRIRRKFYLKYTHYIFVLWRPFLVSIRYDMVFLFSCMTSKWRCFQSTLRCWSIQHIYYLVSCFDKRDKALVLLAPEVYITNYVFDNTIIDKPWYDLHVHKIKSYNRSKPLIKQRIKLWRDVDNLATSSHQKTHCDLKFICICKRTNFSFIKKSQKKRNNIY